MLIGFTSQFSDLIYYSIFIISLIYIIYRYVIAFYAIKQWFHYLFNGKFIVKNSPVDLLTTMCKATLSGFRSASNFPASAGFTYALFNELDQILVKEGKEPFFIPNLKKRLDQLGFTAVGSTLLKRLGIEDSLTIDYKNNEKVLEKLNNLTSEQAQNFQKETGMSVEEAKQVINYFDNVSTKNK